MQELARYWATDYDWRKVEAKLKALPQFLTEIDGLDIHFIHVRSKTKVHMAKRDKGASIYGLPRSRVLGYYRYYSPDCRELGFSEIEFPACSLLGKLGHKEGPWVRRPSTVAERR
jgi:hypothetical protein